MTQLPYDLTYTEPLLFQKAGENFKMSSKKGAILKIEKDDIVSVADVSPLEHWNQESFSDVQRECQKIKSDQLFKDIDAYISDPVQKNIFLVEKFLDFDFSKYTKLPSLKHALSCLYSDYYRQKLKIKLTGDISYQALIMRQKNSSIDQIIQKTQALETSGFKKVKIKIGISDLKTENLLLTQLLNQTKKVRLRLDANLKFSLNDYATILKGLDLDRIDYIEEPVFKTTELLDFFSTTKVHLALDENIHLIKDVRIQGVKSLILKPTLLGDYHSLKKIVLNCHKRGISPVFSSCFESQVGIYQLAQLASQFNPNEIHGLGTFDCFLENLMDLSIRNNAISLVDSVELKGPLYVAK
jgi:o-succinylbenzoate synthase